MMPSYIPRKVSNILFSPLQFINNNVFLTGYHDALLPWSQLNGRPGLNTPHARTMVKTLKLAIYLFLEF
jgi:hypothetical protein